MANKPLQFVVTERKLTVGSRKGEIVRVAHPTGRARISHRNFCEEVARATTFTGAEIEAVLRLAAEVAKKHVENGEIVDYGDMGSLTPSFKSKAVRAGEPFRAQEHIMQPVVRFLPSRRYFTLVGVTYEQVLTRNAPSKPKPTKPKAEKETEDDGPTVHTDK